MRRGPYLYEVGKEQDVGGGRPHVSPWGIPSTTAYHRYPRAAPRPLPLEHSRRDALRCSVAVSSVHVSLVLFLSPLSPNIIDRYYRHTAHRRSSRSAHQHRIIHWPVCPLRVGGTDYFSPPLSEHSTLVIGEHFVSRRIRVRDSPSLRGKTESEWILVSRSDARRGRGCG